MCEVSTAGLTSISVLYVWKRRDREFEEDPARMGYRECPPHLDWPRAFLGLALKVQCPRKPLGPRANQDTW